MSCDTSERPAPRRPLPIRTINARHRKHYKAGSVWKPGEQQAVQERTEKWWNKVKHLFARPAQPVSE